MGSRSIILAALAAVALLASVSAAAAQCAGQPNANLVCASPNGAAGVPTFRALVGADLPTIPIVLNTTPITGGTTGRIPYNNGGKYGEFVVGGDCSFIAPNFTCTKTNGVAFAPSATTDATNASNITGGTLDTARLITATAAEFRSAAANQVLIADQVFTAEVPVTYGTTTAFNFSLFINASVTLTGNISTITFSSVKAGQAGLIRFIQDGTGSRTIPATVNATLKCPGGCNYVLSTTANAVDILPYTCLSATYCVGGPLLKDVK
jgi:hypothetical protein